MAQKLSYPLYRYQGEQLECQNLWFRRIADIDSPVKNGKPIPWPGVDAWKFDLEEDVVFMITIDRNDLQPPPHQKLFE